jgi:hypothetical protein
MPDDRYSKRSKPGGHTIAVDPRAVSASATEPAFIAPPKGAPIYYGFLVLDDVVVDGFTLGMITNFEAEPCQEGDAFLIAPDNSRAGLVWDITDEVSVSEVLAIEPERWGVWAVSFPYPMDSRENARRNLEVVLPILKKKWDEWRKKFSNT